MVVCQSIEAINLEVDRHPLGCRRMESGYLAGERSWKASAAGAWLVTPEPLITTAEAISAAAKMQIVNRRSRIGVSHEKPRVASQARIPVAAAPVVIAVAMHCMHIPSRVAPGCAGPGLQPSCGNLVPKAAANRIRTRTHSPPQSDTATRLTGILAHRR